MSSAVALSQPKSARPIIVAGVLAGSLDISAAISIWMSRGVTPTRVLQSVASGLLGRDSYDGGIPTALLGLLLHYTIAFGAAAVFYAASRHIAFLTEQAILAGALYGVAVYFFMDYVVIPLSRFSRGPQWNPISLRSLESGIPVHILCIGIPIALAVRRFGK